jgi:hypothetical protein
MDVMDCLVALPGSHDQMRQSDDRLCTAAAQQNMSVFSTAILNQPSK